MGLRVCKEHQRKGGWWRSPVRGLVPVDTRVQVPGTGRTNFNGHEAGKFQENSKVSIGREEGRGMEARSSAKTEPQNSGANR